MDYLVTGGAGFIGSSLVNRLTNNNDNNVLVLDDLSMGNLDNLVEKENLKIIIGSVNDDNLLENIFQTNQFDYIFHLAAIASVADSIERPLETHKVNYDSTLNIVELVKKYQKDLKRLVFASSAAVYGDGQEKIKDENSSINPKSQYAVDKYASESTVLIANNLYNINTTAVRFFNVYGPKQNPESPYSGVLSILFNELKKQKENKNGLFKIYGDGEQTRDFIFVEDVIDALILVSNNEESLGEVYNVATGKTTSLNKIIDTLNKLDEIQLPISYFEERIGDIKDSSANIDKLKSLGFSPNFNIEQGLRQMVKYLLEV